MPQTQHQLMKLLYGHDVWAGFEPAPTTREPEGWNGNHPSLKRLAGAPGSKIVIDVGVWKGQSTITMAQSIRRAHIDGCVIAVDTFLGSTEHWDPQRQLFTRVHGLPDLYRTFLSNVHRAGACDYVVPMPQTSFAAAHILRDLGVRAAIVHVDAAHEYQEVLRDAQEYWELLEPAGYLIGDDYHEEWPGVVRAAGELSARLALPLTIEPPKWILQKPAA